VRQGFRWCSMCGQGWGRTADLPLFRRIRTVSGRRLSWPGVPFSWDDRRPGSPYVARGRAVLAPRMAPRTDGHGFSWLRKCISAVTVFSGRVKLTNLRAPARRTPQATGPDSGPGRRADGRDQEPRLPGRARRGIHHRGRRPLRPGHRAAPPGSPPSSATATTSCTGPLRSRLTVTRVVACR
jgi:hypothetical protein